jgi:hypothetical protein
VTGHVWSIRAKLHLELGRRDLALFSLATDSKLRRRHLVSLRVDDVAPQGYATGRANIRQRETGRPVRFELTEQTQQERVFARQRSQAAADSVSGPRRLRSISDDAAVRAPGGAVGCQSREGKSRAGITSAY